MGSEGSGVSPMPAKGIEYSHVLKWLSYKLQCVCILFYSQEKETDEGKSGQQKRQCFILLPRVALSNSKINAHNVCVFLSYSSLHTMGFRLFLRLAFWVHCIDRVMKSFNN